MRRWPIEAQVRSRRNTSTVEVFTGCRPHQRQTSSLAPPRWWEGGRSRNHRSTPGRLLKPRGTGRRSPLVPKSTVLASTLTSQKKEEEEKRDTAIGPGKAGHAQSSRERRGEQERRAQCNWWLVDRWLTLLAGRLSE